MNYCELAAGLLLEDEAHLLPEDEDFSLEEEEDSLLPQEDDFLLPEEEEFVFFIRSLIQELTGTRSWTLPGPFGLIDFPYSTHSYEEIVL